MLQYGKCYNPVSVESSEKEVSVSDDRFMSLELVRDWVWGCSCILYVVLGINHRDSHKAKEGPTMSLPLCSLTVSAVYCT